MEGEVDGNLSSPHAIFLTKKIRAPMNGYIQPDALHFFETIFIVSTALIWMPSVLLQTAGMSAHA